MKKFAILSITLLIVFTFGQIKAQPAIAETKKEIKKEKIEEKKSERPPLKKLEGNVVSQDSQTSFYMSIGNIPDIAWTRDVYYDEAVYTKDGHEMKAYFDINGVLVGTTTTKKVTDLSSSLQKNIKKLYSDCAIGQVIYFQDNAENATDMTLYGVQFESKSQYLVELSKGDNKFVVMGDSQGDVNFFKQL
jgi:hypothetical protein